MKKTITFLFASFLAFSMSAQFSVGLDYMMLSGTMVDGKLPPADGETDSTAVSGSSAVLNVSYTHPLSEKLDMVGSVGLGMGFGLVPMKLGVSYGIASNISANLGMGMYMITDDSYEPYEGTIGENEWKGSSNEFGINLGVKYQMNNIDIGLGYEMIKGGDHSSLNSFTIGLSYAFGGNSADESKKVVKKATKPKKEPKSTKSKQSKK